PAATRLISIAESGGILLKTKIGRPELPTSSADTEQATRTEQSRVAGPPGGVAKYRQNLRAIDLRNRINMLNGFYACVKSWTVLLKEAEYINAAAQESLDVSPT